VGEPARGLRDHLLLVLACRCGERHPGLRKGVALRGAPSERRPRSVRPLSTGSSRKRVAPATADVRRAPRRGTWSRMRPKRMHPSHARVIVACPGRRVLRSVLRHVHVDPHFTRRRATAFVVRRSSRHHGWAKPTQVGGTSTGVGWADVARLAACHRSCKGEAWHVRQGRRSRPPSLRGNESPGRVVARRVSLQKSAGDGLASNKLGKRAPKRAVRVE